MLLAALATAACDDAKRGTPEDAEPAEPSTPKPGTKPGTKPADDPAPAVSESPAPPTSKPSAPRPPVVQAPVAAPPAATPSSRFEERVAEMLRVRKTKVTANPGKTAFAHYKAKRYREAVPLFGAAAVARPTEYKPAFNMACAAALLGDERTAEYALAEALRRDRPTVTAKARKDADLDAMRDTEWFDELLAGNPHGGGVPDEGDDAERGPRKAAFARTWFGSNCADLDIKTDNRRCWDEYLAGDFAFGAPLSLSTTLDIDLSPPAAGPVPKGRWRRVKEKVDIRGVAKTMGVRGGFGLDPVDCESPSDLIPFDDSCPFYRPGFWWPTDELVLLVIPHTQRRTPVTPRTLTLAQWDGAAWKAVTIDSILGDHEIGGAWNLTSGLLLRPDGFEFWTWAAGNADDSDPLELPYLCRIGWHDGALRQACALNWETQFDPFHRD